MLSQLRVCMLISDKGTTATAVINACKTGRLPKVEPVLVICSNPEAPGIQKVQEAGMPKQDVVVIGSMSFDCPEAFGETILRECRVRGVDFIGQYGWMPVTPENVIAAYPQMIIHQHPGPLDPGRPDFGGKDMRGRRVNWARLYFVRRTGHDYWTEASVQLVAPEYGMGALLGYKRLEILETDSPKTLRHRLLPLEHQLQIETLMVFSQGHPTTLQRPSPLIMPDEIPILEQAKGIAPLIYPEG